MHVGIACKQFLSVCQQYIYAANEGSEHRLKRCTSAITGEGSSLPRVKPFKYTYEKEIVMYAYYKRLDFFSTECIYAPHAARGLAREYVKDLELIRPAAIIDLIKSAEEYRYPEGMMLLCRGPAASY